MKRQAKAVAVFQTRRVKGEAVAKQTRRGVQLRVRFQQLPPGEHGFHIHKAGDLRGKGCLGACDHWHVGAKTQHGGPPGKTRKRHTGDLGNVGNRRKHRVYTLRGVRVSDLWGRSLIVHADKDDLGKGVHPDSHTTGHSGKRIACAIFGRA
jgi:Cu-Zn family superoxide dismutase